MRYLCPAVAALMAVTMFAPSRMAAQSGTGLSIGNYQYVGEQQSTLTKWFVTYRADLTNGGSAHSEVTANVTSLTPSVTVVAGQGTLHFAPVPANSHVTSSDTFTILVDVTVPFSFTNLQWAFLSPIANAGSDQTVTVGTTVTLNASGSTNPSGGGALSYNWSFASLPAGSNAVLQNSRTVMPSFAVDVPGNYVVTLTVSNATASDTAKVTVSTVNSPPVANAGANQTVTLGSTVNLNGSGSFDVDGNPLTYLWTLVSVPAGSAASLTNPTSITPSFVADKRGSYVVQLVVNDGTVNSVASTVTDTTGNTPPVAKAGPGQSVKLGDVVQLDGSGSTDVDGDPLTYQWTLIQMPANSTAALSGTSAVKPTFTADLPGTYIAQLIVNDGKASSIPSTVTITTNTILAPTANAGPNQTVVHGTTVTLHGSATDPQSLPLTFKWALTTKPAGSTADLSSSGAVAPTFIADLPGTYVAQLIASNGFANSAPSTVTITTTNTAPVAAPGTARNVAVGSTVALDGSGSHDADNDPLTYSWSFLSRPQGSTAALSSTTDVTPSFIADLAGAYVVQLIVNDGFTNSVPVTVTLTATVMKITLTPNPLNLTGNTPGGLTVNLSSPAGPSGVLVKFTFDPSIVAMPASISIAANATSGAVNVTPLAAGSTNVLASGGGYQPGTGVINVSSPNITVSLDSPGVGVTHTINGKVTLSSPAGPTGAVVSLTAAPSGLITLAPTGFTIPSGSTTGTFTVTGVNNGSATITASSTGFASGTATVLVAGLGTVSLPSNISTAPGQTAPLNVSLSTPAPAGGVTIALSSSDTSKFTVTPSVFVAQNATTPATAPQITGVNFGSATLTASATGYTGATQTVKVGAALSFSPNNLTIGAGGTQNLTLNLSAASPTGVSITLSSSKTSVLTVPATVNIAAHATSVAVPVTAVAGGSATVTATTSAANVTPASATVVVTTFGSIVLPANTSIALGQSASFPITLSAPAPQSGVTITLSSSDATKVGISPTVVTVAGGQTQPAAQPQITGVAPGSATLSASAPGFGTSSKAVQTTATLTLTPPSLTVSAGQTQNLTLTLSGPAPAGGLLANLSTGTAGIVTIPASVTIAANATTATISVKGVASGSTTITAAATSPSVSSGTATVTVQSAGAIVLPANVTVAPGQSVPFAVTLPSPAPQALTVTLASGDSTKLTILPATVSIASGQTQPATQPQVTGVNFGSATITASAPGYANGSQSVTVGAKLTLSPPTLTLTGPGSQNLTLTLSAPAPSGGLLVNLSANTAGVVTTPATVTIAQSATTANVPVSSVAAGTTTITASTSASNVTSGTAAITVQNAGAITLPANVSLGLGQSAAFQVTLPSAAPAGGVTVTLTDSDSTKVGIAPVSVTIPAGATHPVTAPQVTGKNLGTANITASAPLYTSGTQSVQVTGSIVFSPSTLAISGTGTKNLTLTLSGPAPTGGLTFNVSSSNTGVATVSAATFSIAAGSTTVSVPVTGVTAGSSTIRASAAGFTDATASVTVSTAADIVLPSSLTVTPGSTVPFNVSLTQPARTSVFISLTSSDTTKATISPNGVTIDAGQTQPTRQPNLTGVATGQVTITATAPGLATATTQVTIGTTATLTPASLTITGTNNDGTLTLKLSAPAPSPITFTLSSSNTNVATVPPSVLFSQGTQSVGFKVTAIATGTAVIKASAAGFPDLTSNVTIQPAGTLGMTVSSPSVQLQQSATVTLTLSAAAPFGGVAVTVSSNSTNLGVSPTVVVIPQGQTTGTTQVTGQDVGAATISASAPGYTSPAPITIQIGATITWLTPTVTINGIGQQVLLGLKLSATVPQGLNGIPITLTSSKPGVATVPPNVTFFWDGSNAPTLRVPVTSVGPGTTIIHASGTNIPGVDATITVVGPLTFSTTSLPNGSVNAVYSAPLSVSGGLTPYHFTATGLPAGLSIAPTTGLISGTPTAAGTSTVTVTVTDSSTPTAQTVHATLTLLVKVAVPASVTVAGGSPQTANINTAFASPLKALVKDSGGNPLSGITVTFAAPATGASGTFAGAKNTAVTDATGVATSAVFTANNTTGSYSVNATATGVATPAVFALTNAHGAPVITATGGATQSAKILTAFASALIATVKDSGGNPVSGAVVTFTAPPATGASGTFAGGVNTATTNAQGVATSAVFTANSTTGAYTVTASTPGATSSASFALTNLVGDAKTIVATSGSGQSAKISTAFAAPLVATVKDAGGNPVSGVVVTFTAPATGASGTFAGGVKTATTNAQGVATSATFTANSTTGPYTVNATVPGVATPAAFSLSNTQGSLLITATGGTTQSAKIQTAFASPLVATVKDSGGNPIANIVVTFAAPATGASGTFAGGVSTATTNAQGIATSALFTANSKAGTYTVTASAPTATGSAAYSLTNQPGPANSIAATSGTPQSAKVSTAFSAPLVVTVTDAGGNPVSGAVVTFTAPASGASGTFAGGVKTATTNAQGVATSAVFTANATQGAYSVTAATPGVSGSATFALNNTPDVLTITATSGTPQSAKINAAFAAPLVVTVKNSGGNPVNGAVVTFAAPASGASGTFAGGVNTATTNAQGVATSPVFTANLKKGPYTVNATVTGGSAAAAFALTNLTGNASAIAVTSGSGQSAKIKAAFAAPLVATVTDAGGNLVSGVVVTFAAPGSGASGTFAGGVNTATTNAQGIATSPVFTANTTIGGYNVNASVAGVATPAAFALTNLTGDPFAIAAKSGTPQTAQVNTAFAAPLVANVTDAGGNPVSGAVVTFHAPTSGAGGSFAGGVATATTNAQGLATSAVFTANTGIGAYSVTATVTGVAASATFALTNTQIPVGSIAVAGGSQQSAPVNTAFANPLKVLVTDAASNPISGIVVTFTAPATGPSGTFAGAQNTATTNASGIATSAVFTANGTASPTGTPYLVTATAGAKSTTFQLTNLAGPAASITIVGAQQQGTPINTAFPSPLKVIVKDASSNPVSGATVTFTPAPVNGATGSFAAGKNTAVTDATGTATSVAFTANGTVGTYSVVASVPTASGTTSTSFSMTNQPGAPTAITVVGLAQTTPVNTAFPSPLKVKVTDVGGNALRGLTVTFTPPASGASGTFAGGQNTAVTDGTGIATSAVFTANGTQGSYTVSAKLVGFPAVPAANLSLTNAKCVTGCGGTILVSNATIGQNLEAPISITLSPIPAQAVIVTITSSDATKALIGSAVAAGKASIAPQILAGTGSFATEVQALAGSGTATVNISAPGYQSATSTITFAPSGFVLSGPGGINNGFTAFQGTSTALTVFAGPLDGAGVFTQSQPVRGGFTVNVPVTSSDTTIGTVSPAPAVFTGGSDNVITTFTASKTNTGDINVTVAAPSGFATPSTGTTLPISVKHTGLLPLAATTVGQGLEQDATISLGAAAPASVDVTITSSDSTKLLFAKAATGANSVGQASITITIPINHAVSPVFYVQSLASSGSVGYSASTASFGSVNGTIQLARAGFAIQSPGGFGAPSFIAPTNAGAATLDIFTGYLDAGGNFVQSQLVIGSSSVSVSVVSSDTTVATVGSSPITIAGGAQDATVGLIPKPAGGQTVVAVSAPNFVTDQVNAKFTVVTANLFFTNGDSTIGQNLESQFTINLSTAAGAGGAQVTVQSNSAALKLATAAAGAGANSITVAVPANGSSATFFVQGLASAGTGTFTASLAGFTSATGTVDFSPSGIVLFPPSVSGSAGGTTNLTLAVALLDSTNTPQSTDEGPIGPTSLSVTLASDHSSIASVPSTIKIQPGAASANVPVTLGTAGIASISVTQPAGFTIPNSFTSSTVSVQ